MKIELKLKAEQIFYLEEKLEIASTISPSQYAVLSREKRNYYSLLLDCYDKITAKANTLSKKIILFDDKKKHKISFKYHEASVLNVLCCGLKSTEPKASNYANIANILYILIDSKL